jgi:hypothetical protein
VARGALERAVDEDKAAVATGFQRSELHLGTFP